MKRIIKIKESILKWMIILLGAVTIIMYTINYENLGVRNGSSIILPYMIYMQMWVVITSCVEAKIVENRVKDLNLMHIKPYKKSLLIAYGIILIACIFISVSINRGLIVEVGFLKTIAINMVIMMITQYILIKIKMYMGYKVMYGKSNLVIGNKLYNIEGITDIRDDFGSNFFMKVGSEEYEIFSGQLSTKKELMIILGNKIILK
ncbi:MAG: hypothetical protein N4A57_00200 [Anaeromicrobium sp.]|jgi:hypothetical protein|uniref:hypothetical protein n=1 Tax=Anaeromicrobium sp. TaxID=1929132 RepID=UPI0025DD20F0|nr:hypothetical protein [Anaeromicrobium sp.]MCT4592684.1 hypothetical protein [Anaeromicrobium sp.]